MISLEERHELIAAASLIFFRGSLHGYGSGVKPQYSPDRPGWKWHEYREGSWLYYDKWYKSPLSGKSHGRTLITQDTLNVWVMYYQGEYREDAIPCLKAALQEQYNTDIFRGGRGPEIFTHGDRVYKNDVFGNFEQFDGTETVTDRTLRPDHPNFVRGYHKYLGMVLF